MFWYAKLLFNNIQYFKEKKMLILIIIYFEYVIKDFFKTSLRIYHIKSNGFNRIKYFKFFVIFFCNNDCMKNVYILFSKIKLYG